MSAFRRIRTFAAGMAAAAAGAVALLVAALVAAPAAHAFWTASVATGGGGAASTATVASGATPSATVQNRTGTAVTWPAGSLSNGPAATAYTVTRYDAQDAAQTVTGTCAGTPTGLSCAETGLPDGLWTYTVTPRYRNWVGDASAESVAVRTDGTAPVNDITLATATGASKTGNTIYYRGAAAGSFTLRNTLTDAGSGPASSATSALSGSTLGWSHTASTVSTPTGGPYVSNAVSWGAGTITAPTLTVTGADLYGNTAATTLTMALDNTAPTGGAISYANGATNSPTIAVTLGTVADAASGPVGGTRVIQRQTTTLTGTTCGTTYSAWADFYDDIPVTGSVQNLPLTAGQCSRYRYTFTDAVGNSRTTTSTSVVKAKSYTAAIAGTSGLVSFYEMEDSGSTVSDSVGGNDGIQNGTTTGPGAITGDTGTSRYYNGSTDYNRVPRNIGANFSIELWFRTTQSFGSGTQWYNGAGLVDAEVGGVANDFGISLVAGRVVAGTGNTDRSVVSSATYNDGAWHHVVMTRTQGGTIALYVDGASQGTIATNANVLNSSANIDFGRLQTGINYYQGNLDEISFYNRALTAAEVTAHYNAGNAN